MGQEKAVVSRALLLMMARMAGCRKDFGQNHVAAAMDLLYDGSAGQEVSLPYGMILHREQDGVSLLRRTEDLPKTIAIASGQSVAFGDWKVTVCMDIPPEGEYDYKVVLPEKAFLSVTCWESRDRMELPGSRGSRSVKRLAAERGLSPAERDRLPVLRADGRIVAIPGIGVNAEFTPDEKETAVRVIFLKHTEEKHHEK